MKRILLLAAFSFLLVSYSHAQRYAVIDTKYILDKMPEYKTAQKQLDETRSRLRYGFVMGMNSNDAIAGALAQYIALRRSPDTIDKVFALYDSITPEDIRRVADKYYRADRLQVVAVGDASAVRKVLEKYGSVETVN